MTDFPAPACPGAPHIPAIAKRHAITGSRLGRYVREASSLVSEGRVGTGPSGTAHSSKRFVTCPVRCLVYRSIVKRHAITGSRLGRYKESRPASGFLRGGARAPARKFRGRKPGERLREPEKREHQQPPRGRFKSNQSMEKPKHVQSAATKMHVGHELSVKKQKVRRKR